MKKHQLYIQVYGRVQGVYFRVSTQKEAHKLGVTGWVQNHSDGHVEILAQGGRDALQQLAAWCFDGSTLSKVERVVVEWQAVIQEHTDFMVNRSGKHFLEDQYNALKNHFVSKKESIPQHVVIIPDGNRRWAQEHKLNVWKGHEKGKELAQDLLRYLRKRGVGYVTMWGFSTENWKRPQVEVTFLMDLFEQLLDEFLQKVDNEKFRFIHFGRKDRLPESMLTKINELEEQTNNYTDFNVGLALDYGGRDEILRAINTLLESSYSEHSSCHPERRPKVGAQGSQVLTEQDFSQLLDTRDFPDPDLIIRTSGEQRLSGIMPWQSVYAEVNFYHKNFPELTIEDLRLILAEYAQRKRRFGK